MKVASWNVAAHRRFNHSYLLMWVKARQPTQATVSNGSKSFDFGTSSGYFREFCECLNWPVVIVFPQKLTKLEIDFRVNFAGHSLINIFRFFFICCRSCFRLGLNCRFIFSKIGSVGISLYRAFCQVTCGQNFDFDAPSEYFWELLTLVRLPEFHSYFSEVAYSLLQLIL